MDMKNLLLKKYQQSARCTRLVCTNKLQFKSQQYVTELKNIKCILLVLSVALCGYNIGVKNLKEKSLKNRKLQLVHIFVILGFEPIENSLNYYQNDFFFEY